MKTIAFVNQKGGVAKTTSCANIGAALHDAGRRVLLIDLDPQGALSISFNCGNLSGDDLTVYEVLRGEPIDNAIRTERLDIVPTDIRLSSANIELASIPGRDFLLREAIEGLSGSYDYVLIDCPPSLDVLTLIALTAADRVVIPVKADYLALNGMSQLNKTIGIIKKRMNPGLEIAGVIATFYNGRRNLDREIARNVELYFPGKLYATTISENVALAEAPSQGVDIFAYNDKSKGAQQYRALTAEIMQREEL